MLIEQILGNLGPLPPRDDVDWLDLTWFDCAQRALKKRTRSGRNANLLLPVGSRLRHLDILSFSPLVAVNVLPTDVLVASFSDCESLARVALELGNLHVPVEVDGAKLILLPDGPTFAVLERYGIPNVQECRRFNPEIASLLSLPRRSANLSIGELSRRNPLTSSPEAES
jgi:urease accessory protein